MPLERHGVGGLALLLKWGISAPVAQTARMAQVGLVARWSLGVEAVVATTSGQIAV